MSKLGVWMHQRTCPRHCHDVAGLSLQDPYNELKGKNILIVQYSLELTAARFGLELDHLKAMLAKSRERLSEVRTQRPRPHLDSKMLASWNGETGPLHPPCGSVTFATMTQGFHCPAVTCAVVLPPAGHGLGSSTSNCCRLSADSGSICYT